MDIGVEELEVLGEGGEFKLFVLWLGYLVVSEIVAIVSYGFRDGHKKGGSFWVF